MAKNNPKLLCLLFLPFYLFIIILKHLNNNNYILINYVQLQKEKNI